jgi:oxygen-independent coproporphyrinogen-3 oxidase
VVELGHRRGFTVSADLLFNLPGQDLGEMRQDLERADAIGLDHVGLYHLVLFRGLGTAWSREPALLAALPANEQAADHWLSLRDDLLNRGFLQTTLTNFERAKCTGHDRRFVYEECSFRADCFDMLGFGPSAISFAADRDFRAGLKVLNPDGSSDYREAVAAGLPAWDRFFDYGPRDLGVFYLTRRLAALAIDRAGYRRLFGTDPVDDFPREWAALAAEDLVEIEPQAIRPTPRGMFYADSVSALLAWRQTRAARLQERPASLHNDSANDNGIGYM